MGGVLIRGWVPRVRPVGARGHVLFAGRDTRIPPVRRDYDLGLVLGMSWTGCWLLLGLLALVLYWTGVLGGRVALWLGWVGPGIVTLLIFGVAGLLRYWLDAGTRLLRMIAAGQVLVVQRNDLSSGVVDAAKTDAPGYLDQVRRLQRIDRLRAAARTVTRVREWLPAVGAGRPGGPDTAAGLRRFTDQLGAAIRDEAQLVVDYCRPFRRIGERQVDRLADVSPPDAAGVQARPASRRRGRRDASRFSPNVFRERYDGPGTAIDDQWLIAAPGEVIVERRGGRYAHPLRGGAMGMIAVFTFAPIGLHSAWAIGGLPIGGFVVGWLWRKWITPLTSTTGRQLRAGRVVRLDDTPLNRTIADQAADGAPFAWTLAQQAVEVDRLRRKAGDAGPGAVAGGSAAERVAADEAQRAEQQLRLSMSATALQDALDLLRPTDAAVAATGAMTGEVYRSLQQVRSTILEADL